MKYNPPIDGLRAIAVLAVVAYHAGLPVPGGFVGVDIFFVISGYLITRLLHDELQRTGRISFVDFYARRARRILPAIVAVVTATLVASIALLPQADVAATGKAAAAAFVFAANVFFAYAPAGYFDADPQQNPLLHLWSLGVEEQFYLVWPIVLLLARKRPVVTLATIAIASFALSEWLLWSGQAQAAFYQMPARAWELAAGGLIAFSKFRLQRTAVWIGLAAIAAGLILPHNHFPGAGAWPAVLGSGLLIMAFHGGRGCRALELRPMVWIGLRSYSLYLWHWPVMTLGQGFPVWVQLFASFALAELSYRIVETPFRRRWVISAKRSMACATLIVAAGAVSAFSVEPLGLGIAPRPPASVPSLYRMGCDDWHESTIVEPCKFGPDDAPHKAVIIGDSVAMQWFPAVYKIFNRPGWQLVALTKAACPMVDASYFYDRLGRHYDECDQWRPAALAHALSLRPDVVMVGSANSYDFTAAQWTTGTRHVLQTLSNGATQVRLLRSTPLLVSGDTHAFDQVAAWERQAAAGLGNVGIVDMNDVVCPLRQCNISSAAGPIFRDKRHLDRDYAATIAPQLEERLQLSVLH